MTSDDQTGRPVGPSSPDRRWGVPIGATIEIMIGRQTLPDDSLHPSSVVPAPVRERLTLLVTTHGGVHRTFAEAVESHRSGPLWRRRERRLPGGLVHAADLQGERSLCGVDLSSLHEFGRSRHPFERFDEGERCPVCHVGTGPQRP